MKKLYSTIVLSLFAALGATAQVNIGETAYTSLQEAVNAATDGQTITITSDVNIEGRVTVSSKTLTIAAENNAKIVVAKNFTQARLLFNSSANVTLENVTIDCGNFATTANVIEINANAAGATLKNVTIQNANQTANRIILVKKPTVIENIVFENCTIADGAYPVVAGANGLTVKGTGEYEVMVQNNYTFTTDNFTGKIGIILENWTSRKVVNSGNVANFELVNAPEGYTLVQDGEGVSTSLVKNIVTNETTGESFTSFAAAYDAASANDVLVLLEDITLAARQDIKKAITLKGANPEVKIIRNFTNAILFNQSSGCPMILENLVVDANNKGNNKNELEVGNANLTLNNVKIINSVTTQSLIWVKGSRTLNINNVTVENCAGTIGFASNGHLNINGDNSLNPIVFASALTVPADGSLTNEQPIVLNFASDYTPAAGNVVVTNCTDAAKFDLVAADWHLEAKDGNLVLAEGETTGIDAIVADENAPVEYYNLQGIRVAEPSNGIFIRRQGNKTTKVAF